MDLIRTIEEDVEVQNYSEDSDAEVEVSDQHNLKLKSLKQLSATFSVIYKVFNKMHDILH